MKNRIATDSPNYLKFIQARDKALEVILNRAIDEANDIVRRALTRAVEIISYLYLKIPEDDMAGILGAKVVSEIDNALFLEFNIASRQIASTVKQMAQNAYLLSFAGEAEAIGRATQSATKYSLPQVAFEARGIQTADGESMEGRVSLNLARLRRDIIDAVELARVREEKTKDALERVMKAFPPIRTVRRPQKVLTKVKEAEPSYLIDDTVELTDEPLQTFSTRAVNDSAWQKVVAAIEQPYIPKFRDPRMTIEEWSKTGGFQTRYLMDLEQEMANQFVYEVRDAAKTSGEQNDIVDMVWISVVDDKTDECCLWRDGLTSTQIEEKLKSGRMSEEQRCNDVIVPPAHFKCRCSMAPMLRSQLDDNEFEKPESFGAEFDAWLRT